ncbi:MAG: S8 family peptidase, partial [Myxococcaceae bacterium]|nr:S8 family peptidase [Myxococcaceae bacterium]
MSPRSPPGRLLPWALVLLAVAGCRRSSGGPDASVPATGVVSGQLTLLHTRSMLRAKATDTSVPPVVASAPSIVQGPLPPLSPTTPVQVARGERIVPGEVLVGLSPRVADPAAVLRTVGELGVRAELAGASTRTLHRIRFRQADGRTPTVAETRQLAERLAGRPGIRYTVPNRRLTASAQPDDTHFGLQWHFNAIGLPAAWDVANGVGSDVVVAVVDTGVRPHVDLRDHLLSGADAISEEDIAGDGDGRDSDPLDEGGDGPRGSSSWHGTHVSGTVGATTGNGRGVAGVNWGARLLPVRVLGRGGGLQSDILAGLAWAAGVEVPGLPGNPTPARVINLSLGGDGPPDAAFQDVIDQVLARGAVVVVASGNEAEDTARKFPCNQTGVLCVGATTLDGSRAFYSNLGAEVDLMAPGGLASEDQNGDGFPDGVLSTYLDTQARDGYEFLVGTSMAAPHVSGVVSLMLALKPSL